MFLTKDDRRTILGTHTQLFRSQLDSYISSIYQNNSDSFPSRVNGLSSHSILNRFSVPDVSPLAAEGSPNINRKKLITPIIYLSLLNQWAHFFPAGHSAFYIILWIKFWSSSLGSKALYCLRNFHRPGFPIFFSHNVSHLQSSIPEPAPLSITLQIFELCAMTHMTQNFSFIIFLNLRGQWQPFLSS